MHLTSSPGGLQNELVNFKRSRAQLLSAIPDLDHETLANTLEGLTDLREMLAELIRSALDDEALIAALSTRLSDMQARRERLTARATRKRQLAQRAMAEAEIGKLEQPDFTAALRQGGPVLTVTAEEKIPAVYWKPQPFKLDRQGILAALKTGAVVDGAELAAAQPCLTVRTK